MRESTVIILLASYNGEAYLRTMIDSVLAQDHSDIQLVLSDDNSTDSSKQILMEYAQRFPERVTHYESGRRFGCAQKHFMHLLSKFHEAPYIMFCDQDDFWHPDKIRKTLAKMQQIERDPKRPAMVHTDLRVVDRNLSEISPSFCRYSKLDGNRMALNQLLVQNVVTGCTMMINRALAELGCRNIPEDAMLMHDWWLALLAAACGETGFVDEATIDYRQHGSNSVGAKNSRSIEYIVGKVRNNEVRSAMQRTYQQAKAFAECAGNMMPAENRKLVETYGKLAETGYLARRCAFVKYGFYKIGISRIAAQMIWG